MQQDQKHGSAMSKRSNVLVVEDDDMTIELMRAMLSPRYEVFTATNAHEGIERLEHHSIDIILVDISLLGSKNGLELTQEIKGNQRWQHLPIIAVTAHAYMRDKKNALEAGCDYYFAKPINHYQLIDKMEELLHRDSIQS
jgi:CheY-like chemotaxis protein